MGEKSAASMAMLERKSNGPHNPHLYAEQIHQLVPPDSETILRPAAEEYRGINGDDDAKGFHSTHMTRYEPTT